MERGGRGSSRTRSSRRPRSRSTRSSAPPTRARTTRTGRRPSSARSSSAWASTVTRPRSASSRTSPGPRGFSRRRRSSSSTRRPSSSTSACTRGKSPSGRRSSRTGPIDLKAWTREQIVDEAEKSYRRAWDRRAELGTLPVGALGEYVEPNNYPKDVRGTLRDAVSYLFVAAPRRLVALDAGAVERRVRARPRDAPRERRPRRGCAARRTPRRHPIERVVAVLGGPRGLARRGKANVAAELEARLERSAPAARSFHPTADRARDPQGSRGAAAALPRRRRGGRWVRPSSPTFARPRMRPTTSSGPARPRSQGLKAYPESPGGRRCDAILTQIEAPDYELEAMTSDAPDRRSIQVTHKNLPALHFRAYAVDLEKRITAFARNRALPTAEDVRELLRSGSPAARWTSDLPATPDFKHHRTFVDAPAARGRPVGRRGIGARRLCAEGQPDRLGHDPARRPGTPDAHGAVGDRNAGRLRELGPGGRGRRREPVRRSTGTREPPRASRRVTTSDATASRGSSTGLAPGEPLVVSGGPRRGASSPSTRASPPVAPPSAPAEASAALVYTDRAIYRPLQKMLWKVVAYRGRADLGRFEVAANTPVTVLLRDVNGEVVDRRELVDERIRLGRRRVSRFRPGRALGQWRIESVPSGSRASRSRNTSGRPSR